MKLMPPSPHCEESPTGVHYYKKLVWSVFRCDYCWRCRWFPTAIEEAASFSIAIRRNGLQIAYSNFLGKKPKVRSMLEKLERVRLLRNEASKEAVDAAVSSVIAEANVEDRSDHEPQDRLREVHKRLISKLASPKKKGRGRPRTGEWRKCLICGTPIYIARWRLLDSNQKGKHCLKCYRKYILPKVRKFTGKRKPKEYSDKGGLICSGSR